MQIYDGIERLFCCAVCPVQIRAYPRRRRQDGILMEQKENVSYTYIVECSDGTLYTGWTNNIKKRILAHNAKKGAKYTRSRTPVKLVYLEQADSKEQAMRREAQIKQLRKSEKEQLIKNRKELYGNNQI